MKTLIVDINICKVDNGYLVTYQKYGDVDHEQLFKTLKAAKSWTKRYIK